MNMVKSMRLMNCVPTLVIRYVKGGWHIRLERIPEKY